MAYRKITREAYDALLAAYREEPNNHANASRKAGINARTAKDYYENGKAGIAWARAIKRVLHEEEIALRAQMYADQDKAKREAALLREQARKEAIEAHTREGMAVRLSRDTTVGLLGALIKLVPGLSKLADTLRTELEQGSYTLTSAAGVVTVVKLTPFQKTVLVERVSRALRNLSQSLQVVVEVQREVVGDPGKEAGVGGVTMTTEEAVAEIERAQALLKDARENGFIPGVLEGGLGKQGEPSSAQDRGGGNGAAA